MLFVAGVLAAALFVFRRGVTALEVVGCLLTVPLAAEVAARLGAYFRPVGPGFFSWWYWPWLALALAGFGLIGISWSVVRRTGIPERKREDTELQGIAI